jgi:hypothetical protein
MDGSMLNCYCRQTVASVVNNAETPSLEVEKLTATNKGGIGLWVGNTSGGSFANLRIYSTIIPATQKP